jgi:hypothetical protein
MSIWLVGSNPRHSPPQNHSTHASLLTVSPIAALGFRVQVMNTYRAGMPTARNASSAGA